MELELQQEKLKNEEISIFKIGTVYTEKTPGIFDMPYVNPLGACACDCACSCFLAGSLVLMSDGSFKKIEDIKPGEWVMGAFGTKNQVLALDRPKLGARLAFKLNGEHTTTAEHPHVSADGNLCTGSLTALAREWVEDGLHPVITSNGQIEQWTYPGVNLNNVNQIEMGTVLLTVNGPKEITSIEPYFLPPDTQMYNLVMGGSHTYFVEGYAVTGWPRDDDFDYNTWTSKKITTIDDYQPKISA